MITVNACVLYVVAGFGGAGFATPSCYEDGVNIMADRSPEYVYYVDTLPPGRVVYMVEEPMVEYWTEPHIRITFGHYISYVRNRVVYRRSRPRYNPVTGLKYRYKSPPRTRQRNIRKRVKRTKLRHRVSHPRTRSARLKKRTPSRYRPSHPRRKTSIARKSRRAHRVGSHKRSHRRTQRR